MENGFDSNASSPEVVINVTDLGKYYRLGTTAGKPMGWRDHFRGISDAIFSDAAGKSEATNAIWALDRISFSVKRGERVGIIGRNGAGKSTLLKIMSRIVPPTTGEVRIVGRLTSLLEVGTGFNDNLTARENIYLNASLYGLTVKETAQRFDDIIAFSEVGKFLDTPVKAFSSGMKMRLAFAVAAHIDPDILLMDEVLAVGDLSFQRKCLDKVDDMTSGGRTLFFVSHSMDAVMRYCSRAIWMDAGKIRADGPVEDVVAAYVESVLGVRDRVASSPSGVEAAPLETQAGVVSNGDAAPTPLEVQAQPDAAAGADIARSSVSSSIHPVTIPNATAFLIEGSVSNSSGVLKTMYKVDEAIHVRMQYRITEPGLYMPGIHVYCPLGTLAFVSCPSDLDTSVFTVQLAGQHDAKVEIPPNLLNIGTYHVSLVVFSPDEAPFKRHFVAERALSFHVVEASLGEPSARGIIPRPFPGPVRPLLNWKTSQVTD